MTLGIIVTVYNKEKYLERCIDSILNQTHREFKLILVDDGSSDKSGAICDLYAKCDPRITVKHQKNMGEIEAIRQGLELLDTDYVTFVDADDWINESTIEIVWPYMEKEIDVISYCIERYYDDQYRYVTKNNYDAGLYSEKELLNLRKGMVWDCEKATYGIDPSLCNKVVKKEFYQDEISNIKKIRLGFGKDVAITFSILSKIKSIQLLDDVLYYHRQREVGEKAPYISNSNYYGDLLKIYDYLKNNLNDASLYQEQLDYFFAYEAQRKLGVYNSDRIKGRYRHMFPFDKIEKNKRIALFGANEVGQEFYEQIQRTKYAEIVVWVDSRYLDYSEYNVISPTELINYEMDYVVIASDRGEVIKSIKNEVLKMNISDEKIVCLC